MMLLQVVLVALLSATSDGPPAAKVTELTPCPLTHEILTLKLAHPSEVCVWMKDGLVVFDTLNTTYSFKRNETHNNLIIVFVSEKDNGFYECQTQLADGSYERQVAYKLVVKRKEECGIRQDGKEVQHQTEQERNAPSNYTTKEEFLRPENDYSNILHRILFAAVVAAVCSTIVASPTVVQFLYAVLPRLREIWDMCRKCCTSAEDDRKLDSNVMDERAKLNDDTSGDVTTEPVQVLDGNEASCECNNGGESRPPI